MSNFSDGEDVFSKRGFWKYIFPQAAMWYIAMMSALLVTLHDRLPPLGMGIAAIVLLPFAVGPQFSNYFKQREKHEEFKQKYGQRYVDLVEKGSIRLNPTAIMMLRCPGRYEDRLLRSSSEREKIKNA